MNYRKAAKLRDTLMIVGTVVMLLAYIWEPFIIIGAIITVSCLVPHFLYYRCPYCEKHLGRSAGPYCPNCGKRLDE